MKNGKIFKSFFIIFLMLAITVGTIYYIKFVKNDDNQNINEEESSTNSPKEQEKIKELNVFSGNDRVIAVSIDNEKPAWPHSGLKDAYMIYEMIIEGGETRLLALYKGKNTEKIGPIRSIRHYFAHYTMEHGAIFVHFGWSPKAEATIKSNGINNINGIFDNFYFRIGNGYHNAYTSMKNIKTQISTKGYLATSTSSPKYKYSTEDIDIENGVEVNNIKIKYSNLHNVSYEYNNEDQMYYRSMRGKPHTDRETKEQYSFKNIIIMHVKNYNLPDTETKGRQELENIGEGTGYYITNGKYKKIIWKKEDAKSKTFWLYENGEEIVLNDGATFVQLAPIDYNVELN